MKYSIFQTDHSFIPRRTLLASIESHSKEQAVAEFTPKEEVLKRFPLDGHQFSIRVRVPNKSKATRFYYVVFSEEELLARQAASENKLNRMRLEIAARKAKQEAVTQ